MTAEVEIKPGRVRTVNSAGRTTFDTDEKMGYFTAEYSGSFSIPERTGFYNGTTNHLITSSLPSGTEYVGGMVKYDSTYATTDWVCMGGTFCAEFARNQATVLFHIWVSLRIDGSNLYLDEFAWVANSYGGLPVNNIGGTFYYQLIAGGFN